MAKILIADDNALNAELLEAYLDETGWETKIANNGEDTVSAAQQWGPDVILLDVMMPKLSGFEVCKLLRDDAATKNIGILMITALDEANDMERAVLAGAEDFITKPITKSELILRIQALLLAQKEIEPVDRCLVYYRTLLNS